MLLAEHFLNTLALTFISFLGHFVFAVQKHYLFFASKPLVTFGNCSAKLTVPQIHYGAYGSVHNSI